MRSNPIQQMDLKRGKRFREICETLYPEIKTNVGIAEQFGCSESSVRNWNEGAPLSGILIKLLLAYGVSKKFIDEGNGPVLIAQPKQKPPAKQASSDISLPDLLSLKTELEKSLAAVNKILDAREP